MCVLAALCLVSPGSVPARADHRLPDMDVVDPLRFTLDDAIVERHLITARDGRTALAVDLIRPDTDEPVPTILIQSPYYHRSGRGYRSERKCPWSTGPAFVTRPVTCEPIPEWYDEHFVPRGYAVVLQDQRGTGNSSGCPVMGGKEEITDAVDVIEWIASQPWSNGAVGMTGGSYDGTVATGAASLAPPALKAIIPIRAIDRWYDYQFLNGVPRANTPATPAVFTILYPLMDTQNSYGVDPLWAPRVAERKACAGTFGPITTAQESPTYQDARSDFWAERDYIKEPGKIRAATFIMHGIYDDNVLPHNASQLWAALGDGVPKKLWWWRGRHDDPANPNMARSFAPRFKDWTHRWFAQHLKGIDAGALAAPPVSVQNDQGTWFDALEWPPPSTDLVLHPSKDGTLSLVPPEADGQEGGSMRFVSEPMAEDVHIAGQAYVRLRLIAFAPDADVYAEAGIGRTVAVGAARASYRAEISARGASWPSDPEPMIPGREYELTFPLMPLDEVVEAGSRIVLTITGAGHIVFGERSQFVLPVARSRKLEHLRARCTYGADVC